MVRVVRVSLAEDSLVVRTGLSALIETLPDVELVGAHSDLGELLDGVQRLRPDVVITDLRMPPTKTDEGIRAAAQLRRTHPDVGVIVLSQYLDPLQALALVEGGSRRRGYLLKDRLADTSQLLDAIIAVDRGGSFLDPLVVDALVRARTGRDHALSRLTPREVEILASIAEGRSNRAIAAALHVTDRAVEKHINSIFSKLGLTDTADVHRRVTCVLMYLADRHDGGVGTTDLVAGE
jgi:DNA-binding NarL/FixJ family response regulator